MTADAKPLERNRRFTLHIRLGVARLHLAPARARQVAGAARRRQHLGQDRARRICFGEDERSALRQGQRLGSGDHRGGRLLARCASISSPQLAQLPALSDPQMVNELRTHMTRAAAPAPSVETILHAILPYKFVDHTHADAVRRHHQHRRRRRAHPRTLRRRGRGHSLRHAGLRSGAPAAPSCSRRGERRSTVGMVLLNHGIFSFGDDARGNPTSA